MATVTQLGPFRLDAVIASGGMAEVWRGVHLGSHQPVAVKLMRTDNSQLGLWQSAFRAEVRAMARLNHPSVVRIHDYGTIEDGGLTWVAGTPWLAMELVEGGTLADRVPQSWTATLAVLSDLLDALAAAHAHDVVHRDIKPANVLVSASGAVKLTDFGIAHALDRADLADSSTLDGGTPPFMAPEQFEGRFRDTGPWTDLYALGCLAWYLLCGRPPYGKQQNWMRAAVAHAQQPLPDLQPRFEVPEGVEGWLHRLLQKEPSDRFRMAADAAWALGGLGSVEGPDATAGTVSADAPTVVRVEGRTLPWRPRSDPSPSDLPTRLQTPMPAVRGGRSGQPMAVALPPIPQTWDGAIPEVGDPLGGAGLGLFGLREFPVIGREQERRALWEALLATAADHRPRMVILTGAAGTGKSRLAEWFAQRTRTLGVMTWSVATHAVPQGPGDGAAAMIRRDLALGGLSRPEAMERIKSELVRMGTLDSDEILALGALTLPPTPAELAQGARTVRFSMPTERYALVSRHLRRRSEGRVAGLWLDDAQWGIDGLQMSRWLLETYEGPLVIVATVRDEALAERAAEHDRVEELGAHPRTQCLSIPPLGPPEQTELLQRWLGLAPTLAARVRDRTAGNPLFAVQLVGDWVDRDLLRPTPEGFVLRGAALEEIPDDLHATWIGRVDRVVSSGPPSWRPALELAAALGMEVEAAEWRDVCARSGLVLPEGLVDALVRAKLARAFGRDVWRFEHAMLRESIERDARERGRWVAHNLICVEHFRDLEIPGRVGRHLFAADRWDDAAEPLLVDANATVFTTHLRRAEASLELAAQALELAGAAPTDARRIRVKLYRCRVFGDRGELEQALRVGGEARELARQAGLVELEADALIRLGEIHRDRPDVPAARALFQEALQAYSSIDNQRGIANALHELGRVAMFAGDFELARALHLDAMDRFERYGEATWSGVANCHRALGELEVRREADLPAAARHFREAGERYRALGMRFGEAAGLNGQAEIARLTGDLEAAEDGYKRAIRLSDAMGHDGGDVMRINLGICRLLREDFATARAELAPVLARMEAHARWGLVGFIDVLLLYGIAAQGDWSAWAVHGERADRYLRESRLIDRDTARFAELAGDRAAAAGKEVQAEQAREIARWQWEALGEPERAAAVGSP